MKFPNEETKEKDLTKYYYTSEENVGGGVIYKISTSSNGCKDAKQMTNADPIKITLTYKNSKTQAESTGYVYLDSYIECGDVWDVTTHTIKPHNCPSRTYDSLYDKYKDKAMDYVVDLCTNYGYKYSSALNKLPKYFQWDGKDIDMGDNVLLTNVTPKVYLNPKILKSNFEEEAKTAATKAANAVLTYIDEEVETLTMTYKEV